jgi:hypothetical protein
MSDQITIVVDFNNPQWVQNKTYTLPFQAGLSVHGALCAVYDAHHATDPGFTFDVRYSGATLGNFLQTLCGVPTTPSTSWEILINGAAAQFGVDTLLEVDHETIRFVYVLDKDEVGGSVTAKAKRART